LLYGVLQKEAAVTKSELSDPIALRIPLNVLAQIEAVAAATERTRSWVIVRALRYYLGGEGSEILAAIEGRRQIAEGKSHEMDDVIAELDAIAEGKAA
jgi:predicted transcriptional regulator